MAFAGITARYGAMNLKLKRTPGIFLVGFMGSGKSTVGRFLADEVGWKSIDLDEEIERQAGMSIPEMFDQQGEAAFRALESKLLAQYVKLVQSGRPHVLSLGGGAFHSDDNFKLVTHNGISIWLDCPLEKVERRLAGNTHRPLARDPLQLRELYASRREGYARADCRVEVQSDDPAVTSRAILELPLF